MLLVPMEDCEASHTKGKLGNKDATGTSFDVSLDETVPFLYKV